MSIRHVNKFVNNNIGALLHLCITLRDWNLEYCNISKAFENAVFWKLAKAKKRPHICEVLIARVLLPYLT